MKMTKLEKLKAEFNELSDQYGERKAYNTALKQFLFGIFAVRLLEPYLYDGDYKNLKVQSDIEQCLAIEKEKK